MLMRIVRDKRELALFISTAATIALVVCALVLRQNVGAMYEVGDFAATSLLVEDAKHQFLMQGHYSRTGINHPGPAILYSFAVGQFVFYDWLRIADSQIAGQLAGIACYAALWLAMCGILFNRIVRDQLGGLILLSAFMLASAYAERPEMFGIWFPYPVYLPFSVFTLALSRLCIGKADSLIATAVSCGFLWHGHVSFLAITALMVFLAFLCVILFDGTRLKPSLARLLRFVTGNWIRLLVAGAILFVFLLPLIIRTIREFPDPIRQYLSYKTGRHSLVEALYFAMQYWGDGVIAVIVATLLMVLLVAAARRRSELVDAIGVFYICIIASIALIIYAMIGVDYLDLRYIGMFYQSVPAICFAFAVYAAIRALREYLALAGMAIIVESVISVEMFGLAIFTATQPPRYTDFYNDQTIPLLYEKFRNLAGGKVAIDLVQNENAIYLWTRIAGVAVYAKRLGQEPFCIDQNWHILFTKALKCTVQDLDELPKFEVSAVSESTADSGTGTPKAPGIRFDACGFLSANGVDHYSVAKDAGRLKCVLGSGWSGMEADLVWSDGNEASLKFAIDT